jgi:hypothetical protein
MEPILEIRAVTEQAPAPRPVFTAYEKIVAEIMSAIDEGVARLPGYHQDLSALPKTMRRLVTSEFLGLTVSALDASEELQGVNQLDITDCRDALQFSQAVRTLILHFQSVTRRLELLSRMRDAKAGRRALRIYHIAKRLASDTDNTHLAVHVENLKAELQRSRLKRRTKASNRADASAEAEPA